MKISSTRITTTNQKLWYSLFCHVTPLSYTIRVCYNLSHIKILENIVEINEEMSMHARRRAESLYHLCNLGQNELKKYVAM